MTLANYLSDLMLLTTKPLAFKPSLITLNLVKFFKLYTSLFYSREYHSKSILKELTLN